MALCAGNAHAHAAFHVCPWAVLPPCFSATSLSSPAKLRTKLDTVHTPRNAPRWSRRCRYLYLRNLIFLRFAFSACLLTPTASPSGHAMILYTHLSVAGKFRTRIPTRETSTRNPRAKNGEQCSVFFQNFVNSKLLYSAFLFVPGA